MVCLLLSLYRVLISFMFEFFSKPAITDHLEIDQYMWAILDNLSTTDTEEVTIDASANWKALRPLNSTGIKVRTPANNNN